MDIDHAVYRLERELNICTDCHVPMKEGKIIFSARLNGKWTAVLAKCKKCPLCGKSTNPE